jgi:hypothetical protein
VRHFLTFPTTRMPYQLQENLFDHDSHNSEQSCHYIFLRTLNNFILMEFALLEITDQLFITTTTPFSLHFVTLVAAVGSFVRLQLLFVCIRHTNKIMDTSRITRRNITQAFTPAHLTKQPFLYMKLGSVFHRSSCHINK